jgi:cytochrome P450
VYSTLSPGESLDELSVRAAGELQREIDGYSDALKHQTPSENTEHLLQWMSHFVSIATTRFLYGPKNPIDANPELEKAFWDFDRGIGLLLLNVLPSITARKALNGREAIVQAFYNYLDQGHHKSACSIVQQRVRIAQSHGFSLEMTARAELSFLFAGIVNTATTSFWMVAHIVSRPALLKAIREELEGSLSETAEEQLRAIIQSDHLDTTCPLFLSVFRETLRLGSDNFSSRVVTTDTMLADKYFLRAKSIVQISGGIIHGDSRIWGSDVDAFNPQRFADLRKNPSRAKERSSGQATKPQIHPAAFRAFGGGTTLCPGRHFATKEIMALVASIILRFDISSCDGGEIKVPKKKDYVLPVHILEPVTDIEVKVRLRSQV